MALGRLAFLHWWGTGTAPGRPWSPPTAKADDVAHGHEIDTAGDVRSSAKNTGEIEVQTFLPVKGPRGTYSHFWMSRAIVSSSGHLCQHICTYKSSGYVHGTKQVEDLSRWDND